MLNRCDGDQRPAQEGAPPGLGRRAGTPADSARPRDRPAPQILTGAKGRSDFGLNDARRMRSPAPAERFMVRLTSRIIQLWRPVSSAILQLFAAKLPAPPPPRAAARGRPPCDAARIHL